MKQDSQPEIEGLIERLNGLLVPESPMHPIGCSSWMEEARVAIEAVSALLRRLVRCCIEADAEAEESHRIGRDEGYEQAVQDIDLMTGGDGEYRFCTDQDPERHTPDAATMKARIAERYNDSLSALLSLKEGGGLGSSSSKTAALLASQASCSAMPSSTGKED